MERRADEEDREDARRVLAGDPAAFEGIVRRWQGPLVNLAYRFCRNRGLAEEMAQEAFLQAFRKLESWREEARFSTWMFALALNVYRSRLRRARPLEIPISKGGQPRAPDDPAERVLREQTDEIVRRSVTRLPRKYREAIVLVYFEGLDVAGAAAVLDLPEGTVKARLFRGRELLRRRLEGLLRAPRTVEAT